MSEGDAPVDRPPLGYPIEIAEMRSASRDLDRLLTREEKDRLVDYLALHPDAGAIIPETGGIRKLRWGMSGKGKSKGLRVLYYFRDLETPLFVVAVYSKGEVLKLTKREERELADLAEALVSECKKPLRGKTN